MSHLQVTRHFPTRIPLPSRGGTAMVPSVMELWEQAILPYNLPFTILLGLVVVFWILTLLGAVGMDSLDVDLDAPEADASGRSR